MPRNQSKYKFSVGVVINRNTIDYLYCVVAEVGSKKNGMGEVSIYATWKIIVYDKSAPSKGRKKNLTYGWKYKYPNQLRKQIVKVGKKFYKGGRKGKCLN